MGGAHHGLELQCVYLCSINELSLVRRIMLQCCALPGPLILMGMQAYRKGDDSAA